MNNKLAAEIKKGSAEAFRDWVVRFWKGELEEHIDVLLWCLKQYSKDFDEILSSYRNEPRIRLVVEPTSDELELNFTAIDENSSTEEQRKMYQRVERPYARYISEKIQDAFYCAWDTQNTKLLKEIVKCIKTYGLEKAENYIQIPEDPYEEEEDDHLNISEEKESDPEIDWMKNALNMVKKEEPDTEETTLNESFLTENSIDSKEWKQFTENIFPTIERLKIEKFIKKYQPFSRLSLIALLQMNPDHPIWDSAEVLADEESTETKTLECDLPRQRSSWSDQNDLMSYNFLSRFCGDHSEFLSDTIELLKQEDSTVRDCLKAVCQYQADLRDKGDMPADFKNLERKNEKIVKKLVTLSQKGWSDLKTCILSNQTKVPFHLD